jgi:hypothetical protein
MLTQGKVSTIAIGGRPQAKSMATIGGVAGSEMWFWSVLSEFAGVAQLLAQNLTSLSSDDLTNINNVLNPLINEPPVNFNPAGSSLNFLNNFAGGDLTSNVPLQFQTAQPAGCHMFNILDDLVSVGDTWERIAAGNYDCVDGGTKW